MGIPILQGRDFTLDDTQGPAHVAVVDEAFVRGRHEIGIRVAPGAQRSHVVRMVMREAAWLLMIGIVIGIGSSLLAGPTAGSLLFGLKPHDPVTLIAAALLLIAIASIASFVPARNAARLEPLTALRRD
jgi:ABC-type antimicrobial peptide transport system permease subunit